MKPNPQVLLVDRNSNDVKVVRDTLGSAGLEIHVRASASAALVAFHALEPDLVIVDSDVPGTSGAAVTREIKNTERGRSTPVILMTEGPIEETKRAQTLTASGCTMLLQKPLMPQDLLDTLSRFLPGAFIGKDAQAAPAPKSTAPRRAAGVMRDPGTPFTADSFDEDSLRALLDQVFPSSDSGSLAQTIRARSAQAPEAETKAAPAAPAPSAAKAPASETPAPPTGPPAAKPAARPTPATSLSSAAPAAGDRIEETTTEHELSTTDIVAEYLAKDSTALDEENLPKGLSVKDGEALDRIFDGPSSHKAQATEQDIEPRDTASPSAAPVKESAAASRPTSDADTASSQPPVKEPAKDAKDHAPASTETSFLDGPLDDIGFEEPASGTAVWQEIEAALPPAPPSSAPAPPSPVKTEAPRHEPAKSSSEPAAARPATSAPAEPSPVSRAATPSVTPATPPVSTMSAKSATPTTTTPDAKTSVPVSETAPPLAASSTPNAAAPHAPATIAASPSTASSAPTNETIETIPLARETAPAHGSSATSMDSRRSKKNKKAKGRQRGGPEPIPLAAQEPETSMRDTLRAQSVAESLTTEKPHALPSETSVDPVFHEVSRSTAAPRRTGAIAIVTVGLMLAAAVAIYFVLTRSGDSDLQPTSPGRVRTSHASIKNEEPRNEEPGLATEELPRETLPPIIPESQPPSDAAGAPAAAPVAGPVAAGSESPASRAESSARSTKAAPGPDAARTVPAPAPGRGILHAPEPSVKASASPGPAHGPTAKAAPPAVPTTQAPSAPAASEPSSAAPPARTPSSEPAQDHPAPPTDPPAPSPDAGSTGGGSGPPALGTALPPNSGAGDSPTEMPPAPAGHVALGATLPTPAEAAGAGVPEVDAVQSLASPVPLSRPAPAYPPSALTMKLSGTVGLLVKVEADGHVSDVKVVRAAAPALNAAAVAAARQWSYKPAHRGMDSVATWIEESVVFKLK